MRKRDFWHECYDREVPERDFRATFCNHCRNPECALAGWSKDLFSQRVQAQEDLLFNPKRGMANRPLTDFGDLLHKAVRLEIADRRGDWSLPEEPPTGFIRDLGPKLADIPPQGANDKSESQIQDSLRALKQEGALKNSPRENPREKSPNESRQETRAAENHHREAVIKDLASGASQTSENEFAQSRSNNGEVSSKNSSEIVEERTMDFGGRTQNPSESKRESAKVVSGLHNTPLHWAGVMLDGSKPNPTPQIKTKTTPKHKSDPWSVKPKPKFQDPGARIRFGGKKNGKK